MIKIQFAVEEAAVLASVVALAVTNGLVKNIELLMPLAKAREKLLTKEVVEFFNAHAKKGS
jgi:hypothetical protein